MAKRIFTLPLLFLFFCFLSGCSLLFVAKGKSSMATTKIEKAPEAVSLEKKMSRQVVLHYKAQQGDTLDLVAQAYYGDTSFARKIAQQNHLNPYKPLTVGKTLKIVDPVNFPDKGTLDDLRKKMTAAATPSATVTSHLAFSEPDTAEDEKDVEKIPRPTVNKAFAAGEKLTFEVRAIGILGGYATLEVDDYQTVSSRPCYPLTAKAKSAFPFSSFYPVNDVQTSFFDAVDFITWRFQNDVHEGDYEAHNRESYDQLKHTVVRQHNQEPVEQVDVQPFTQDIISCFYYFRLLPLDVGKKFMIPTCSGGKNYKMIVAVVSREKVTVPAGTFDCFRTKPFVKYGTVFRNKEDIDLWVTADSRHIPVLIKSAIVVGNIQVSLMGATVPDINGDGGKLISRISQ